jgi:hypothetical protein
VVIHLLKGRASGVQRGGRGLHEGKHVVTSIYQSQLLIYTRDLFMTYKGVFLA